jgi:hypothetical protein
MARATQQRDPITGRSVSFGDERDDGKRVAQIYFELAVKHYITFGEIFRMAMVAKHGPEAWDWRDEERDLRKAVQKLTWEAERDAELMSKFDLPIEELVAIWRRGRDGLLRYANFFPNRREKIEAFLAEREAVMIAMLERHAERQRNG